jgi:hypothetical protein
MSYLSQPASSSTYGVVEVGNFINVSNGVLSLPQDISTTSNVTFNSVNVTNTLTINGASVLTSVAANAGTGISITEVTSGTTVLFTVTNTGVLSLTAGTGITVSTSTGNVTVAASGTASINTTGTTVSYAISSDDEYIGVNSTSTVTITLPTGTTGKVYTIKDEHGVGLGNINIAGTGGETIDGVTPFVISIPNEGVTVVFRAGGWHII